jgi:hypothetical protein
MKKTTVKEEVNKIEDTHEPIFEAFASLLPVLQTPSLLSDSLLRYSAQQLRSGESVYVDPSSNHLPYQKRRLTTTATCSRLSMTFSFVEFRRFGSDVVG